MGDINTASAGVWTMDKLLELHLNEIMELFASLSAPSFDEMNGEYASAVLDQGNKFKRLIIDLWLDNPLNYGHWLGKAFTRSCDTEGQGYNLARKYGQVIRKVRMKTYMSKSRHDQKDVFFLDYSTYFSQAKLMVMRDEIRKVHDGLYLGIGSIGSFEKMRRIPWPFALSGPVHEYVGHDRRCLMFPHG
ncbi:MAG: hypothetical protein ACYC99_10680 [Candidatus Geothermincolia bacterium]